MRLDRAWVRWVTSMDSTWMIPGRPRARARYLRGVCAVGLPSASQLLLSVGWYTMRLGAVLRPMRDRLGQPFDRHAHTLLFA